MSCLLSKAWRNKAQMQEKQWDQVLQHEQPLQSSPSYCSQQHLYFHSPETAKPSMKTWYLHVCVLLP